MGNDQSAECQVALEAGLRLSTLCRYLSEAGKLSFSQHVSAVTRAVVQIALSRIRILVTSRAHVTAGLQLSSEIYVFRH